MKRKDVLIDTCLSAQAQISLNVALRGNAPALLLHNLFFFFFSFYHMSLFNNLRDTKNRFPLRYVYKSVEKVSTSFKICPLTVKKKTNVKKSVLLKCTVHACELKVLTYSATKSHEWSFVGSYVRGEGNQTPCLPFCTWLGVNRVRTTGFVQEGAWPHNTDDVPLLELLEWKISL